MSPELFPPNSSNKTLSAIDWTEAESGDRTVLLRWRSGVTRHRWSSGDTILNRNIDLVFFLYSALFNQIRIPATSCFAPSATPFLLRRQKKEWKENGRSSGDAILNKEFGGRNTLRSSGDAILNITPHSADIHFDSLCQPRA